MVLEVAGNLKGIVDEKLTVRSKLRCGKQEGQGCNSDEPG